MDSPEGVRFCYASATSLDNEMEALTEQVDILYKKLNANSTLSFYCVEDVAIVLNGVSTIYPANSNVEIKF